MNTVKIKKTNNKAKLPEYMTSGAAAMDMYACLEENVVICPGERFLVSTGIAIGLQKDMVAILCARSGLAIKQGLTLSNGIGVIDSDYTGEIKVGVINLGSDEVIIQDGMRIAQLMIMPVIRANLCEVAELDKTERGDGGFGSTGKM